MNKFNSSWSLMTQMKFMDKNVSAKDFRELLLVESSTKEAQDLIAVVQDYDVKVYHFSSSIEAIQFLQEHNMDFVIIEEHSTPMDGLQTIEYLRQEMKLEVPIFISSRETESFKKGTFLQKPFLEDQVIFSLFSQKGMLPREQSPKQEELISLNYLEELSGGNKEFIENSLEIFLQSVSVKLKELQQCNITKDYGQAREIAHSIKPSFQMLMNSRGAEICDEINYRFKEENFASLLEELQEIFKKIKLKIEEKE